MYVTELSTLARVKPAMRRFQAQDLSLVHPVLLSERNVMLESVNQRFWVDTQTGDMKPVTSPLMPWENASI